MESSVKKSGSVEIPKRKSLDLKSLYNSRVSDVGESKKQVYEENDQEDAKKKNKRNGGREISLSCLESDSKKSRKESVNGTKSEPSFVQKLSGGSKLNKRNGGREISLSCLESDAKKSRKECVNGTKSEPSFVQKLSGESKLLHGISFSLDKNGNGFNIPKRPRGLVGRRKLKSGQVAELLELSNSNDHVGTLNADAINEAGPNVRLVRSVTLSAANDESSNSKSESDGSGSDIKLKLKMDSKSMGIGSSSNSKLKEKSDSKSTGIGSSSDSKLKEKVVSKSPGIVSSSNSKLKRKRGANEVKKSVNDRSSSVRQVEIKDDLAVNNGETSSKKRRCNNRRKKDFVDDKDGGKASSKKSELSLDSSESGSLFVSFLNEEDDDEENLEQNAARMLSSRFDPSCTGFTMKKKSSVSQGANGFSVPVSPTQESFNQQDNSLGALESASAVDKSRELRPRREDKGKDVSRKRRHFYEILSKGLDAYWFLNRRIKVFWPLDESWYFGLVNDYHPECKLHHIKYDDRDEEWVDLQEEKFKILLLPSEVPGKPKPRKNSTGDKDVYEGKNVPPSDDDSSTGNYLDSEPIALWLARSSHRLKYLPKSLKKQRTSQVHLSMGSPLSSERTDNTSSNLAHSKRASNELECESAEAGKMLVHGNLDQSQVHLHDGSSLSSERHDNSNRKVAGSKRTGKEPDCVSAPGDKILVHGTPDQSLTGTTSNSQNGKHAVYVRKKYNRQGKTSSSVSRDVKSYSGASGTVTVDPVMVRLPATKEDNFHRGCLDSDSQLWLLDDKGKLGLNAMLVTFMGIRFQICLPSLPFLEFSLGTGDLWLLHNILILHHGSLVATSPAVILEMLFIDDNLGLRFLLFEGCLKQALAIVFSILIVFGQPDEQWNGDMQLPVTSIRFTLSSIHDLRKQYIFAIYSFSRLQKSKWLYLYSKLMQHCCLINQLPVSKCTYDNIKELEYGNSRQCNPYADFELSALEGFKKKFVPAILPMGASRESCNTRTRPSAFNLSAKPIKVHQSALSFSAPNYFLPLHLRLLMEQSCPQPSNSPCSPECLDNGNRKVAEKHTLFQRSSIVVKDIAPEDKIETVETDASVFKGLSSCEQDSEIDVILASNVVEKVDSSEHLQKGNVDDAGPACCFKEFKEITPEGIAQSHQCEPNKKAHQQSAVASFPSAPTSVAHPTANPGVVDIPSFEQVPFSGKGVPSRQASDVGCNINDGFVHCSKPTGSISSWKRGSSSISSPLGDLSPLWPDGKTNFMRSGFGNGPKKPRTQVQYTLPFAGYEFNSKQKMQNHRALPCKRIRRASLRRISDGSKNDKKNLELLACGANVLVTHGDKGWRECGAHIFLEVADHNEWRLAVKLSGITKYSYKVKHILQPGSTNRYSHAMMWKGGNDWVLEFPDRSQWTLFKEMHEECYNRNIRAASVKHIPIPGVWLVEERNDCGTEVLFVRNSTKYFRQVQNDVEMALDPLRIVYDLDSDDEQWLIENRNGADRLRCEEISDEFLEKTIDVFEKVSYVRHRENFTDAEIEDLVIRVGSLEAAKVIYEYWRQKRERKGMPLIRHLQPPLWDRYQQQLKNWELTVARGNGPFSVSTPEKPPMFAFCLKPRGLDVPNKGSKQRSHRKISVSGHHHTTSGDQDSPLVFGRRSNGPAFGDEKVLYASSLHDSSDVSPSLRSSMRLLSPRNAHFSLSTNVSEWNHNSKLSKYKPKKVGSLPSFNNQQMMSNNQRIIGKSNVVQQWNMGLPELSSQRHGYFEGPHRQGVEQFDSLDLQEFRLREASGAAQHALKMAKLKREKAQRLFARADLAIHKAVVALMTAEAIKTADENSNGDN